MKHIDLTGRIFDAALKVEGSFNDLYLSKASLNRISGKRITTFGDSITATPISWAYKAAVKLNLDLYNYAVGGYGWQNMSLELNACKAYTDINVNKIPDLIVIAIGTNNRGNTTGDFDTVISLSYSDLTTWVLANQTAANLYYHIRWSIETLKLWYPHSKIILATPIQRSDSFTYNNEVKLVGDYIKRMANYEGITVVDGFHELGLSTYFVNPFTDGGGLHLSEAGYLMYGNYMTTKMLKLWHSST